MRLVVDTNVLSAGILRAGTTRGLLIDPPLRLLAPERALAEIRQNAEAISSRSKLSLDGVELLLALLTEDIEIVPRESRSSRWPWPALARHLDTERAALRGGWRRGVEHEAGRRVGSAGR